MMNSIQRMWVVASIVTVMAMTGCQSPGPANPERTESAAIELPKDPLHPRVKIETSLGDIMLSLDGEHAPAGTLHFAQYIEKGFYNGTIFHRVPDDPRIIQAGGYLPDMKPKSARLSSAFSGRWSTHLKNVRGTVTLLRGQGPAGTGLAEFFINVEDNRHLDNRLAGEQFVVLGTVVDGMDVVEKIRSAPLGTHPDYAGGRSQVVPVTPIVIRSMRIVGSFDRVGILNIAEGIFIDLEKAQANLIAQLEEKSGRKLTTTDSGLMYIDLVVGQGAQPLPTDLVEFHYRGTLLDGTLFETTFNGEPTIRQASPTGLIAGMAEGILGMNEGGRRTLIIPFDLAFGVAGIPGIIPPRSTLVFEIELLAITGPAPTDEG